MGDEIVTISKLPRHSRLHVGIVGFRIEFDLADNFSVDLRVLRRIRRCSDLEQSRIGAQFSHQRVAIV